MHYRTRYRVSAIPIVVVTICLVALFAVLAVPAVASKLAEQLPILPWLVVGVAALLPTAFGAWYFSSYADVSRNVFRVRSMLSKHHVDLRTLTAAEVYARSHSKRKRFELILRLEDELGREVWLPLNSWRDEDLLMARVLRATVDCKVRIEGEPMLVRRFSGLLETYKSWDRQQKRAA